MDEIIGQLATRQVLGRNTPNPPSPKPEIPPPPNSRMGIPLSKAPKSADPAREAAHRPSLKGYFKGLFGAGI